jgi:tRNA(Ile2)-agmatinylcytidine synthase
MRYVGGEPIDRWLTFETNQGTDDHIVEPDRKPELFHSYLLRGTVSSTPRTLRGGHVFFSISTEFGSFTCAAFEETKEFRNVIKNLAPGDTIRAWGSLKPGPSVERFNLEKLEILSFGNRKIKISNPTCQSCGRKMKSAGRRSGYRCRTCHTKTAEPVYATAHPQIMKGLFAVAAGARRHLTRPPELMAGDNMSSPEPPS